MGWTERRMKTKMEDRKERMIRSGGQGEKTGKRKLKME